MGETSGIDPGVHQRLDGEPLVGILCGSASDLPAMQKSAAMLSLFEVPFEMHVMSAHRSPDLVDEYSRLAEDRGLKAIICGAGRAAHLAGAVSARTTLPVIGVPLGTSQLGGADALYSTVQMPRGVPVATVGIEAAENAAVLAAQIVALGDEDLRRRLREFKESLAEGFTL